MPTRILTEAQLAEINARNRASRVKPDKASGRWPGDKFSNSAQVGRPKKPRAPKAPPEPTEHQSQVAVIEWWDQWAPEHGYDYRLLWACPSGGKRHVAVAIKLKCEGVRPGVPDLQLAIPKLYEGKMLFAGFFCEMKRRGTGVVSPAQLEYIDLLRRQGYNCVVCYSADEAIRAIEKYITV